jgi:hypothetical protein
MKIKNILTLTILCAATSALAVPQANQKKNGKIITVEAACPGSRARYCPDACAEADRAERRRIDPWQDPLLAAQLQAEADRANAACLRQDPNYTFPEERALAQQEMPQVD